jgi:hypothetical protein
MRRGKVIGALVLVVAIGLIVFQQLGNDRDGATASREAMPASTILAQTTGAAAAGALPALTAARVYTVDPSQSEIYWRIYKAGAMARLGHNHVISVGDLSGSVTLGNDLAAAQWYLSFPVAALVVDDPEIRARHGEEFASVPSDNDKAGTKSNMLTAEVLNAEAYTEIRLHGQGLFGSLEAAELPVSIEILGRTVDRRFSAQIVVIADSVTVSGTHRLSHADLGMSRFEALGGLMSVGEDIDLTYRIHAVAGSP